MSTPSLGEAAANRNQLWGRVLLDELVRAGLEHIVLSPGSRSTPLVLAAARDQRLRLTTQIDERSAGFLALGVGKATGNPAAVITTSGTAVANLLPAVVEAAQSETPLLVLTADRPPWLRGADANQTIQQHGIFGDYVRLFEELFPGDVRERALRHLRSVACRATAAALGDPSGPVHLNLPFAKPLGPTHVSGDLPPEIAGGETAGSAGREAAAPWTSVRRLRPGPAEADVAYVHEALARARAPLLVAGVNPRPWEVGLALGRLSSRLAIPLMADCLSGARYGAGGSTGRTGSLIGGYDIALSSRRVTEALRPDLVLRVGSAATSAALAAWLETLEGDDGVQRAEHLLITPGGRWKDHAAVATRVIAADPTRFLDALLERETGALDASAGWLESWQNVEREVRARLAKALEGAPFEGSIVADIVTRMGDSDLLFVSNSMPVRDLDTFVPFLDLDLTVLGNRGASGIDGVVSTAAGASLATGRRVIALVGDLALLHDSNGLASLRERGVRVLVVVLNNDGGGIFHRLPIREVEPEFTRFFATPHGRDLSVLAAFHGLPYVNAADGGDGLSTGWATAVGWDGSGILEMTTDRARSHARRSEVVEEIASAIGRQEIP